MSSLTCTLKQLVFSHLGQTQLRAPPIHYAPDGTPVLFASIVGPRGNVTDRVAIQLVAESPVRRIIRLSWAFLLKLWLSMHLPAQWTWRSRASVALAVLILVGAFAPLMR